MKRVVIGGTLEASAIVLGFWRTAGIDDSQAQRLIGTAYENGIDLYDTADIYGGGEGERILGRTLAALGLRDSVMIETKCGIRPDSFDFSKEYILASVDGSLERLQTDHIDILTLHRPDALVEPDEVGEAFDILKSSGKVLNFAVSNQNARQIELLKTGLHTPLLADQLQFGLGHAQMIDEGIYVNTPRDFAVDRDGGTLEYCRINGITIQCWSPLMYGFFGPTFLGDEKYKTLNERLAEIGDKYGITPAAAAFAWILRHPANMQALTGTRDPQHLKEICAAGDVTLTRSEWYYLYTAVTGERLP
ncbi:MAG: aldo/keto reductase [Clostridia bacterium]|nr:aldo/keto reductase [Clostridia bacterium]